MSLNDALVCGDNDNQDKDAADHDDDHDHDYGQDHDDDHDYGGYDDDDHGKENPAGLKLSQWLCSVSDLSIFRSESTRFMERPSFRCTE